MSRRSWYGIYDSRNSRCGDGVIMTEAQPPPRTLAEKLNHLFGAIHPTGRGPYSNEEVAASIGETGVAISQSYIWLLRKGQRDNPTLKHIEALAKFFGVPAAYFFDDHVTDRISQQLQILKQEQARLNKAASSEEAKLMAMRAGELSPGRRRQVRELLDIVYQLEQAEHKGTLHE